MKKRESFIFYRSFFESTKPLSKNMKAELFNAICEYALNQNEIEKKPIVEAMFGLIKPQLDANNKRYEGGLKGGRPKREKTITEPNDNLSLTIKKPNPNLSLTTTEPNANENANENENVNKNKNKNVKLEIIFGSFTELLPDECEWETEWIDWIKYRKEIKKKITESTAKKQIKFLDKQPSPKDVISQTIQNGWTGLFPIGKNNGTNKKSFQSELYEDNGGNYIEPITIK